MRQDSYLSHRCPFYRGWLCGKEAGSFEKENYAVRWLKGIAAKSMDMCTGRHNMNGIMLETAFLLAPTIHRRARFFYKHPAKYFFQATDFFNTTIVETLVGGETGMNPVTISTPYTQTEIYIY